MPLCKLDFDCVVKTLRVQANCVFNNCYCICILCYACLHSNVCVLTTNSQFAIIIKFLPAYGMCDGVPTPSVPGSTSKYKDAVESSSTLRKRFLEEGEAQDRMRLFVKYMPHQMSRSEANDLFAQYGKIFLLEYHSEHRDKIYLVQI